MESEYYLQVCPLKEKYISENSEKLVINYVINEYLFGSESILMPVSTNAKKTVNNVMKQGKFLKISSSR